MSIGAWKDEAKRPAEVHAARLFEQARGLSIPNPPAMGTRRAAGSGRALRVGAGLISAVVLIIAWQTSSDAAQTIEVAAAMPVKVEPLQVARPMPEEVVTHEALPPPVVRRPRAVPARQVAEPEIAPVVESTLGAEAQLIATAMQALRNENDPPRALEVLGEYHVRFPQGVLAAEAWLAQVKVERALHHPREALALLDRAELTAQPAMINERDVTRGELLAELDSCPHAEAAFTRAIQNGARGALAERASWGRANCAASRFAPEAEAWLRAFVVAFPNSQRAPQARELIEALPH